MSLDSYNSLMETLHLTSNPAMMRTGWCVGQALLC